MYVKDSYEAKHQFLINKRESIGLKHFNDPKAFIEYANDMQVVYKIINECNPGKNREILIVFDYMIADMINNKKLSSIVIQLFAKCRKLNISLVFITQSYFRVPKGDRLLFTHFFIMKITNKRELQQIALNKKCTAEPYSFLVDDATLKSDNPLRFRKNL